MEDASKIEFILDALQCTVRLPGRFRAVIPLPVAVQPTPQVLRFVRKRQVLKAVLIVRSSKVEKRAPADPPAPPAGEEEEGEEIYVRAREHANKGAAADCYTQALTCMKTSEWTRAVWLLRKAAQLDTTNASYAAALDVATAALEAQAATAAEAAAAAEAVAAVQAAAAATAAETEAQAQKEGAAGESASSEASSSDWTETRSAWATGHMPQAEHPLEEDASKQDGPAPARPDSYAKRAMRNAFNSLTSEGEGHCFTVASPNLLSITGTRHCFFLIVLPCATHCFTVLHYIVWLYIVWFYTLFYSSVYYFPPLLQRPSTFL